MSADWTTEEAIRLCQIIEAEAPNFGGHVALTGGCLYKDGPRKDADILIYRIRQAKVVDWDGLFERLTSVGVHLLEDFGWCKKALYLGRPIDIFDPDDDGAY